MSASFAVDQPAIPREKTKSWLHQRAAFWFVIQLWQAGVYGALLAMEMGTGKSKVAIDLAGHIAANPILIVCPLRVVEVWERQLELHASFPYRFLGLDNRFSSVEKKAAAARDLIAQARAMQRTAIIAVNFESAYLEPFRSLSLANVWGLVIADEIHRIKSPSGKHSRYMAKLAQRALRRLGLSGTPMPHSPLDLWALFRFLYRSIFDDTYTSFKLRYADWGGFAGRVPIRWKNQAELIEKFLSITFRVQAKDVLDLPEEMDERLYCNLNPKARTIYQELEENFVTWLAETPEALLTIKNALGLLLRLQQLTGGTLKDDTGEEHRIDSAKEDLLVDWLEDIDSHEPVVVFALFHADLDTITRACKRAGRPCFEASGRVKKDQIGPWKAHQPTGEEKAAVLAAQIQQTAEGVDLTKARYGVYYSTGFNLGNYIQSRKRIHRPGQTRQTVYYHLLVHNSVDDIVLRAIENRWDLIRACMKELDRCHRNLIPVDTTNLSMS